MPQLSLSAPKQKCVLRTESLSVCLPVNQDYGESSSLITLMVLEADQYGARIRGGKEGGIIALEISLRAFCLRQPYPP